MLATVLGAPGMLLFAMGCPIIVAVFLAMRRDRHNHPHFLALYHFLYEEYRPE